MIDVDYEVGGKKYRQTLDRNGDPFRVTASLCPRPEVAARLSPNEVEKLKAQRYGAVTGRYLFEDGSSGMRPAQPSELCKEPPTS